MFGDQTTGSYAAEIGKVSFVTGSSFPCLSVFKPLSPKALVLPENEKDALAYWVRRELVNRHIMSGVSFAVDYLYAGRELERSTPLRRLRQTRKTKSKNCPPNVLRKKKNLSPISFHASKTNLSAYTEARISVHIGKEKQSLFRVLRRKAICITEY